MLRSEIEIAPFFLRAGASLASVAPGLAARLSRQMGGEKIAQDLHNVARLVTQPPMPKVATAARPWWMRLGARATNA